ncbi:hypothetical protein PBY51_019834 [Eleginops maclovinus]|uniref:RecA family profile 1 domain-containing protein n=1 Tax=Eleginops maclovinus TaxID=56733 RepID=A0AAN8AK40_ELEMC|nr:hypothetical protein PBY51_019834 [Eleginops maclovinus]
MDWDQLELTRGSSLRYGELRLSGLSRSDTQLLLTASAVACRRHPPLTALLSRGFDSNLKLSVGCPILDELLRGGLPVEGVTELSGESGAGKTQLALQICLSVQYPTQYGGLNAGAVFICTEDSFPVRRLQQLIQGQSCLRSDVPPSLISSLNFSDRVYIEHAADLASLQVCVSRRVPLMLARGLVRLVVVDSVAALFRSDFLDSDWLERNKQLLTFSSALHHLSREYSTPVLCINQVTDVFSSSDSLCPQSNIGTPTVAPALGERCPVATRAASPAGCRWCSLLIWPGGAGGAAVWREGVRGLTETS